MGANKTDVNGSYVKKYHRNHGKRGKENCKKFEMRQLSFPLQLIKTKYLTISDLNPSSQAFTAL